MPVEKITRRTVDAAKPKAKPYEIRDTEASGLILRIEAGGVKTYFYTYRLLDGRKRRIKIGRADVLTPAMARDKALAHAVEVLNGSDPAAERREKRTDLTLDEWLDTVYKPWAQANLKSAKQTLEHCRHGFKALLDKKLGALTAFDFEKNRVHRSKTPCRKTGRPPKAATLNRGIATMKAALNRAVQWGHLAENPLAKVRLVKEDRRVAPRYLTPEEEVRLLAALRERDTEARGDRENHSRWRKERGMDPPPDLPAAFVDHLEPLVILALHSGLRRGELFNLTWQDVDLEARRLVVHGSGAKSGRTRHLPLSARAAETLTAWKAQGVGIGLVFPGEDGKRLDNVDKAWRNLLRRAGIQRVRFHDLRHTFASRLVQRGADLAVVRELLGHSDFTLTLRYAHLASANTRAAVALLDMPGDVVPMDIAKSQR